MKTFLTLLGILFIQVLSAQEASPKHKESIFETIPFEFTKYNNIVIDAIVNDVDSVRLMFHTAADDVSLIKESTKKLKSINWNEKVGGVKSWGGSNGESRVSFNNTIKINKFQLDSLSIWVNKYSGHTTDGKFGPNFFGEKHIEINFDSSLMIIHNALPSKIEDFYKVPIKFENGFMFVEATSIIGEKEIKNQYLIHSGYSGTILLDDNFVSENEIANQVEITEENELLDSAGNVMIEKKGKLPKFIFGNEAFQDIPVGFFEGAIGRQKMSLIGGSILKRFNIIIDAERENLYLQSIS